MHDHAAIEKILSRLMPPALSGHGLSPGMPLGGG